MDVVTFIDRSILDAAVDGAAREGAISSGRRFVHERRGVFCPRVMVAGKTV